MIVPYPNKKGTEGFIFNQHALSLRPQQAEIRIKEARPL